MISFSNWASWVLTGWQWARGYAFRRLSHHSSAGFRPGARASKSSVICKSGIVRIRRQNIQVKVNQIRQAVIWFSEQYSKDVAASLVVPRLVILTISRSKSLSDQTSSIVYCCWAFAKDTEPTAERKRKTFVGFINSKFEWEMWCVTKVTRNVIGTKDLCTWRAR